MFIQAKTCYIHSSSSFLCFPLYVCLSLSHTTLMHFSCITRDGLISDLNASDPLRITNIYDHFTSYLILFNYSIVEPSD